MEIKKSSKADLEGKKGIFFEIGLVIALAILLFAFEWRSSSEEVSQFQTVAEEQIEEEIIPITQQMLKPPPPPPPAPKLSDLLNIVETEAEIDEELEIEDADDESENKEISDVSDFEGYGDEDTGEQDYFDLVEDMPQFPTNLNKWLSKNIRYPAIAQENGITGRVIVRFIVDKDGSVTDVTIARGVDPSLDKEALRVIKSMPKWKPGKQRNKPVRVRFTIPIVFGLKN